MKYFEGFIILRFQQIWYENLHKTYVKHLICKLYYQQLHLKYLCNLARYWLQAPWGWHESVKTCGIVIICEIIVLLLIIVENNNKNKKRKTKNKNTIYIYIYDKNRKEKQKTKIKNTVYIIKMKNKNIYWK